MTKDLLLMLWYGMMEKYGGLHLTHRVLRMSQIMGNLLTLLRLLIISTHGDFEYERWLKSFARLYICKENAVLVSNRNVLYVDRLSNNPRFESSAHE